MLGAYVPFVNFGKSEGGEPTLPPVADAGANQTVDEGDTVNFDGSGSFDQDTVAGGLPITFEWDFDTSNGITVDGTGATPSHVYTAAGTYTVQLTYTDDDGETDTDFVTIVVIDTNDPPEAEANGPYNVPEGGTVLLSSAGSSDPDGDPLIINWDLDDDGDFDDFNGPSPLFSAAGLNGPSSVTVEVQVCDGQECDTDTATVNIVAEAAPPFTETLPLPDSEACICTPPLMNQEASGVINWFAQADGTSMTVSLITQSVNAAEQGDMQIDIFEDGNPTPLASRVQTMPTTPGSDLVGSDTIATVAGDVYRVRLTRIDPVPPTTTGTVVLRDPSGTVVDTQSDTNPAGIDVTVQGSGAAGLWSVEVSGMNHHYVVEKLSGSDTGVYATWLTFGAGKVDGTVQRGGLPFTGNFKVEVTNLATGGVTSEPPSGSFTGNAFDLVLPVGSYSLQVIPDSPLLASNIETVYVTCQSHTILHFEIPNRDPNAVASDVTINEGDDLVLDGSASDDPDGDAITGGWSFDGDAFPGLVANISSASQPIIQDDLTNEPATLTVTDPFGAQDSTTVNVTVLNVDPEVSISLDADSVPEGSSLSLDVTFTDAGILDTHTVTVDWGDGTDDDLGTVTSPPRVWGQWRLQHHRHGG